MIPDVDRTNATLSSYFEGRRRKGHSRVRSARWRAPAVERGAQSRRETGARASAGLGGQVLARPWGLEAAKIGRSNPPALLGPVPFAHLRTMIDRAETALEAFTPDEVDSWTGRNLDLQIGPRTLSFTSESLGGGD